MIRHAPRPPLDGETFEYSPKEDLADPRALRSWRCPLVPLTFLTSPQEKTPAWPMVILSAPLLRRLLKTARAIGPRPPPRQPEPGGRLDIRV